MKPNGTTLLISDAFNLAHINPDFLPPVIRIPENREIALVLSENEDFYYIVTLDNCCCDHFISGMRPCPHQIKSFWIHAERHYREEQERQWKEKEQEKRLEEKQKEHLRTVVQQEKRLKEKQEALKRNMRDREDIAKKLPRLEERKSKRSEEIQEDPDGTQEQNEQKRKEKARWKEDHNYVRDLFG